MSIRFQFFFPLFSTIQKTSPCGKLLFFFFSMNVLNSWNSEICRSTVLKKNRIITNRIPILQNEFFYYHSSRLKIIRLNFQLFSCRPLPQSVPPYIQNGTHINNRKKSTWINNYKYLHWEKDIDTLFSLFSKQNLTWK